MIARRDSLFTRALCCIPLRFSFFVVEACRVQHDTTTFVTIFFRR